MPTAPSKPRPRHSASAVLAAALALALVVGGCSLRTVAVKALGRSLAASGDVFASDEDPELVAEALPFALKTMEALLAEAPRDRNLLLASCRGFTQYAYAFVESEAFFLEHADYRRSRQLVERALKLYLRGRDYCLRALERSSPGILGRLQRAPEEAAGSLTAADTGFVVWAAAAWGSAISLGQDRPALTADVPAVKALFRRALELDEAYDDGLVHEALISLEALPEVAGGSPERARAHFERAVELSGGTSVGPYVTLARTVVVAEQDAAEFRRLLRRALAIDPNVAPSRRLANILAQRQARELLDRIEDYFLDPGEDAAEG